MIRTLHFLLTLSLVAFTGASVFAQEKKDGKEPAKKDDDRLP